MGCAGSKADDSPGGRSREASAPASAPAVRGDAARAGRGALGARSPAGGVSKKVLEQLRSAFLVTATPGSVYDYYALSTTLGTGGYAVVKLGTHKSTGQEVAVKIMRLPLADQSRSRPQYTPMAVGHTSGSGVSTAAASSEIDVFKEIEILKTLDHPSVLKMFEYFIGGARDKVYIVTELMRGGELLDALLERGSYSEDDARVIFRQILSGVQYLHSKGITHRDLKLENLLLADKDDLRSVRIADFGLAKATFGAPDGENPFAMEVLCGTLAYVAPEVLSRRPYGPAVDLWSCGVCLYILLAGVVPFSDPNEQRLVHRIVTGKYSLSGPEWGAITSEAKSLVKGLMCLSPGARLTAAAALAHPWLRAAPEQASGDGSQQHPLRLNSKRLAAYAARAKPPVVHFTPGDFLIRRGQRATEVFLIREGTVEVVVDDEDADRGDTGVASYTTINTRGPGEFVGEQGVITNAAGDLTLSSAARSSMSTPATTASAPSGPETAPASPSGGNRAVGHAPSSGLPPRPPGAGPTAAQRWNSPLAVHKFAKKWVGQRRTASVRAVTDVVAVALRRNDMEWALLDEEQEDNDMRVELHTALARTQTQRSSQAMATS